MLAIKKLKQTINTYKKTYQEIMSKDDYDTLISIVSRYDKPKREVYQLSDRALTMLQSIYILKQNGNDKELRSKINLLLNISTKEDKARILDILQTKGVILSDNEKRDK